ncbi:helix-turn-helix transcriptional regulator [Klebsiella quasipneumoniae]|uniref:helix-turn-helix transcriptional regulator n=1 Tax=Klebsiella quasipneumoniae TaxID=1463165 RepID=UPI0007CD00C6|nr:AlpA family transcriptional regulator [Klebsiella quasipneumoniae]SAV21869.1 transcriptional regulator AlpA family [Klebsiella quasipneumoniae]
MKEHASTFNQKNNNHLSDTDFTEDRLVDMAFITAYTGLTDKWFYKLIKDGEFPKPIKLGRSSRWTESEVKSWLKQRMEKSRGN